MSSFSSSDEVVGLWNCLHDGSLKSLSSDSLDRSIELLIDVPYLWSFHSLPAHTRFRLRLQAVSAVEALRFVAWPCDPVIPEGSSWEDSEAIRKSFYAKGRLESEEWQAVAGRLVKTEEYEISHATIATREPNIAILTLQLLNDDLSDYPEIRITAERIHFFLGPDQELSLPEFLDFGESYWRAFAERRPKL